MLKTEICDITLRCTLCDCVQTHKVVFSDSISRMRPMGEEVCYEGYFCAECLECGEELSGQYCAYEYPMGAFNCSDSFDVSSNCEIIEEPEVIISID